MRNTVDTRVGKIAYSDTGEGPVVVLLHATLHDRRDFDAIAPSLRRDHRVIALDWPGHGDSPPPVPSYRPTAASFADVLADVVATLDLPPAAFVGNSVGGFAAARLGITDPQRVSRLVLVNTGGFTASPITNLYCRTLGMPAVMKRVLPRYPQLHEGDQRQRLPRSGTRVSTGKHPGGCRSYSCIVAQFRCARI
jgi:pimeloyl-ACP methyl ester carboxylesterase